MELDVTINEVKHIENLHPREMRRQALEGLVLWQKRSSAPLKDLLNVFRTNKRQDMIELIEEMQESTKKSVKRKRSLPHSYNRRSTIKRRAIHANQSSNLLSICEETKSVSDTDMNSQTESQPSTSIQQQAGDADEETTLVERRTSKLNMTTMTVNVLEMSSIKNYGNRICKSRIGILLHSDEYEENIRASAFGKNVQYISQNMKPGMLYNISGYELRTSEYVSSEQELILSRSTMIEHVPKEERFEATQYESNNIADIKDKTLVRKLQTVGPIIITSVGPARKPNKRFLKEVMLKDKSGKIKMNIWGFGINDIQFWYKRGEVLKLQNVEVGRFKSYDGDEYFLTAGDFATFERNSSEKMQHLLKNEDERYLIPETMDIKDVVNLERSKHLIYITSVKIESFAKKSHVEMIIKHCEYEESHGKLKETDNGWYCEECQECQEGEDKVRLKAEFVDSPISSDTSLWVTLFDKSSQTILGNKYESFRQSNNAKKRRAILRKVEKQETVYRLEISFNNEFEFQTATKIEIIPQK
ncbi:Hypothetical predicted protein [Mytilus galloprovincialis]|nr:Hypothetical predicted protein [Mytilus galloprovincialis]